MTLEQLVTDLATSQQLRDKGFPQDTVFKWCRLTRLSDTADGTCEYSVNESSENYYVPAVEVCAAPTAGELEEWLFAKGYDLDEAKNDFGEYIVTASKADEQISSDYEKTHVAALAALVLEVAG